MTGLSDPPSVGRGEEEETRGEQSRGRWYRSDLAVVSTLLPPGLCGRQRGFLLGPLAGSTGTLTGAQMVHASSWLTSLYFQPLETQPFTSLLGSPCFLSEV